MARARHAGYLPGMRGGGGEVSRAVAPKAVFAGSGKSAGHFRMSACPASWGEGGHSRTGYPGPADSRHRERHAPPRGLCAPGTAYDPVWRERGRVIGPAGSVRGHRFPGWSPITGVISAALATVGLSWSRPRSPPAPRTPPIDWPMGKPSVRRTVSLEPEQAINFLKDLDATLLQRDFRCNVAACHHRHPSVPIPGA